MFKVIVERPRAYGCGGDYKGKPLINEDTDLPHVEGMKYWHRRQYGGKSFNEHLSPLERFIRSKVGFLWDDVWSELCSGLSANSTTKKHVRDHVFDYVEVDVEMIDGEPYSKECYYRYRLRKVTSRGNRAVFYVHPETGILCLAPMEISSRVARKLEKKKKQETTVTCVDGSINEKLDGVWYNTSVKSYYVSYSAPDFARPKKEGGYETKIVKSLRTETIHTQLGKKYLRKMFQWKETGVWPGKAKCGEKKGRKLPKY
jgi:hypothetical protein